MRVRTFLLSLGCALLLALPVLAQGIPTGTLSGRVMSAEGEALPGVTVSVSSPSLQGARTATTNENGDYSIPLLPPGEYQVKFELEGFGAPERSVKISASQNTRVDADLSTSAVSEEIVVTGSYETISTTPEAATTYEKEFVESLPVERNVRETVLLTPGVTDVGPGTNSRLRAITISGAQTFENLFLVNGVVVNENLRGQPLGLFIEDAIEETTTMTSGISAEYGRFQGGVVNTITRSGGNELHGSIRDTVTNNSWEAETPKTVNQLDKTNQRYEATLGGYILKDRIWYFLAGRDFENINSAQTVLTNRSFPAGSDQQRYEGKLTLTPFQGHRLTGSYISVEEEEVGNRFGNILDLRSLVVRSTPQELLALNYNGVVTENFFVEAQYSERKFTFEGSGSKFRDRIFGTLLVNGRTGHRFWSPTFCGVCTPEQRDNENMLLKGSLFLASEALGSHDLAFGYDTFKDIRLANNYQSGSDFRIILNDAVIRNGEIYPVLLNDPNGTLGQFIQWNPIVKASLGTDLDTNSIFLNDRWRLNDHWSFNLGVRYDENDGTDAEGRQVTDDSKISPRISTTFDPKGDGDWVFTASYGQYVAAVANSQANSTSQGGNSANYTWFYRGPSLNADPNGPLIGSEEFLRQLFAWFDAQGGTNNTSNLRSLTIPGGTSVIRGSLNSPSTEEYTVGAAKRLGNKGVVRADYVHRDGRDFYLTRTNLSTGRTTVNGRAADLTILGNDEDGLLERTYDGLHTQIQYRLTDRINLGGIYALSRLHGNFNGETTANGPVASGLGDFPEYFNASFAAPTGDLPLDQRHRLRFWGIFDVLQTERHNLSVSVLQNFASGSPYGAAGAVATRNFVTNPGYVLPPAAVTYFYTDRDAFRTDDITATDLSLNYGFNMSAFGKNFEIFVQPEVLNAFNQQGVLNVDATVLDATNNRNLQAFNPFTTTPVEGVHWQKGPNFGKPLLETDYQTPRTYRFSVGFRF